MKDLYRKCPICSCREGKVYKTINMELSDKIALPTGYDVVCCEQCGFTFADVDASQREYNMYYEFCNMYSKTTELKAEIAEERESLQCEFLEKYVDKDSRILDVGCGTGNFLQCLKERGFKDLFGLDPSAECIEILKKRGLSGRTQNAFDKIPEELRNSFDVVVSTTVMEHIYDLNFFVEQLIGWLKWGGCIYITVPAVEGFEKVYTQIPNYFNHEHINYFSLLSLDNLFAKHGFMRRSSDEESLTTLGNPEFFLSAVYMANMKRDTVSEKSIVNYLMYAQEKEKMDFAKIQDFVQKNTKIVIWGTGSYTMQMLTGISELKEKIAYFIDNNDIKIGQKILGKEVYGSGKLLEDASAYPILICSMGNSRVIEEQIKKMGIANSYMAI